jgi:hypothetical protein
LLRGDESIEIASSGSEKVAPTSFALAGMTVVPLNVCVRPLSCTMSAK